MNTSLSHFGLGSVAAMVGLQPSNLKKYGALALGGVGGVMGSDFLQSQLLPRIGVVVPVKWAPLATALLGVMGGTFVTKKLHMPNIGTGMLVGGLAVGASAAISMLLAPAVVATTDGGQPVAGLGFGRIFSRGVRGLAGFGRVPRNKMLFGAGTPNMAGARMFNGATVAIEQPGMFQGATVAIEPSNRFAAALT